MTIRKRPVLLDHHLQEAAPPDDYSQEAGPSGSSFARGRPLRMTIRKRPVLLDHNLQEAGPSGWLFARGWSLWIIICKRLAPPDDHLQRPEKIILLCLSILRREESWTKHHSLAFPLHVERKEAVRLEKSLSFVFSTLRREEFWRKHILTIFWLFHVKQRGKSAHAGLPHLRHTSGVNFILQIAAIILLFLLIIIIKSCCSKILVLPLS